VVVFENRHLRDVDFSIRNRAAFDRFGGLLDGTLNKHDTLHTQPASPLDHLFGDLARSYRDKGLNGVGTLTEGKEHHLGALRTTRVHTSTQEYRLAIVCSRQRRDLRALFTGAGLGLVQRKFAVEFGGKVLRRRSRIAANKVMRRRTHHFCGVLLRGELSLLGCLLSCLFRLLGLFGPFL
jgi:hypothetical protein